MSKFKVGDKVLTKGWSDEVRIVHHSEVLTCVVFSFEKCLELNDDEYTKQVNHIENVIKNIKETCDLLTKLNDYKSVYEDDNV